MVAQYSSFCSGAGSGLASVEFEENKIILPVPSMAFSGLENVLHLCNAGFVQIPVGCLFISVGI